MDLGCIGTKNEVNDIKSIGILEPGTCTLKCKKRHANLFCCCGGGNVCAKTRPACRRKCGDKCCATK